jgi:flagellar biosynthesis protein FlhB
MYLEKFPNFVKMFSLKSKENFVKTLAKKIKVKNSAYLYLLNTGTGMPDCPASI